MSKPRVVKDYEKLTEEVIEQIKLVYPLGFSRHLVSFLNKDGEKKKGLPFETDDFYYLIRMTEEKAEAIIEEDDDYDDDGILKSSVKEFYEDKYIDEEYLNDLNANKDNDLGNDEDDLIDEEFDGEEIDLDDD
jgi:hypothetical protein